MTVKDLGFVVGKQLLLLVTLMVPALISGETVSVIMATVFVMYIGIVNILNEYIDVNSLVDSNNVYYGLWVLFIVSCFIAYKGICIGNLELIIVLFTMLFVLFFIVRYIYLNKRNKK